MFEKDENKRKKRPGKAILESYGAKGFIGQRPT